VVDLASLAGGKFPGTGQACGLQRSEFRDARRPWGLQNRMVLATHRSQEPHEAETHRLCAGRGPAQRAVGTVRDDHADGHRREGPGRGICEPSRGYLRLEEGRACRGRAGEVSFRQGVHPALRQRPVMGGRDELEGSRSQRADGRETCGYRSETPHRPAPRHRGSRGAREKADRTEGRSKRSMRRSR